MLSMEKIHGHSLGQHREHDSSVLDCCKVSKLHRDSKAESLYVRLRWRRTRIFHVLFDPVMAYSEVKARMHRAYNFPAIKATIKSNMDSLDFDTFMRTNDMSDPELALRKMIEHVNQS